MRASGDSCAFNELIGDLPIVSGFRGRETVLLEDTEFSISIGFQPDMILNMPHPRCHDHGSLMSVT
jgi:hypothetical protein